MSAGERIREDRLQADVSLRQLAEDIGISGTYLSDVEKDRRKMTVDMATRITAAIFKHSADEGYRKRYDWLLLSANIGTAERRCLENLFVISAGDYPTNKILHRERRNIYEALYGKLDRCILGEKYGNRYDQFDYTREGA